MAPKMTEYEKKRLENIRRNQELLASLKIHSTVSDISSAAKRPKVDNSSKSYKTYSAKKKSDSPPTSIVVRRSRRAQGLPPSGIGSKSDADNSSIGDEITTKPVQFSPRIEESFSFKDAYQGPPGTEREVVGCISSLQSPIDFFKFDPEACSVNPEILDIKDEHKARLVPGRIFTVKFLPRNDLKVIVAGNISGNVAFWNVDYEESDNKEENNDGISLYRPHSAPVSGAVFHHKNTSKIFTSSYDGFLRSMDAEKEMFDLVYRSGHAIFSLNQNPQFEDNLYLGEGNGLINVWDHRAGRSSCVWDTHESRINSIEFNPQNLNMMVTSSTDGTACIWDIRKMRKDNSKTIATVSHKKPVHGATFSPSGTILATTSMDDTVGLTSGTNFDDVSMIPHYNQTGRWVTKFRAAWSWDDSHLFIGNMKRGVDVISTEDKRITMTIRRPNMTAIPCRFDKNPFHVGMMAGATSGGQVYIFTPN